MNGSERPISLWHVSAKCMAVLLLLHLPVTTVAASEIVEQIAVAHDLIVEVENTKNLDALAAGPGGGQGTGI